MATSSGARETVSCDDFALFQDVLKRLRTIDDRVTYALNSSLPTESFRSLRNPEQQCQDFYNELSESHDQRSGLIKRCIMEVSTSVGRLRKQREENPDDPIVIKQLMKEQHKLRQMQSEVNIDEVVRDRSLKVFYERCRLIYLPADFRPIS